MATSFGEKQQLEQAISKETKPDVPPSTGRIADLKALSYFEDRLNDNGHDNTLVDLTAQAELRNVQRGMYLLQNSEGLKSVLGEGLQASLVAAKLADQHTRERLFKATMESAMETQGAVDAQLGLSLRENMARVNLGAGVIQGLGQMYPV